MKILRDYKTKIKTTKFGILILLAILLFGFANCENQRTENSSMKKPSLILVFCDISNSVDNSSVNSVITKAKKIISSLSFGSRIAVYPIDNNDYPEPIFELTVFNSSSQELEAEGVLKEVIIAENNKKLIELLNDESMRLENNIKQKYEENIKDKSAKHQSCIINKFTKVNEFFKNEITNKFDFDVIFLSDMIEQCNSKIGSIFMCGAKRGDLPSQKEKVFEDIENNFSPAFNLKELLKKNISIVITTKMLGDRNYKCYGPEDHKQVWEITFNKIGYSSEEFNSLPFSERLPNKFSYNLK